MPSPDELNDPFEGQLLPVGSGIAGNSINTAAGKFNRDMERFLKNFRILSFSANIRNKAMWAHYSDINIVGLLCNLISSYGFLDNVS